MGHGSQSILTSLILRSNGSLRERSSANMMLQTIGR